MVKISHTIRIVVVPTERRHQGKLFYIMLYGGVHTVYVTERISRKILRRDDGLPALFK